MPQGLLDLIPSALPPVVNLLALMVALTAAFFDIRWRKIPNWLALAGLLLGLATNTLASGWRGLGAGCAGMLLALLIYFPLYLLRGMGAGDVKLMAALGSVAGPVHWLFIFAVTSIAGAIAGLILVLVKGRLRSTLWNVGFILRELISFRAPFLTREQIDYRHKEAIRLPHAVPIAIGTVALVGLTVLWRP